MFSPINVKARIVLGGKRGDIEPLESACSVAKKKPGKNGGERGSRQPPRDQRFTPSGAASLESFLRKFTSGRGKTRNPLVIAQEIADLAWEASQPQDQAELARRALSVSADCADAYVILANQAASREQARQLLEEGVAAGQRAIGSESFESATGNFWLDQRTRPYMRARLGLAQCLWESGQRSQAADHYTEMLRLNPNDNQGVRYLLLGALVDLDRDAEARGLIERYQQDGSAEWAYTIALLAYRGEGDSTNARSLLWAARDANRHVPDYLVGNRSMPPSPPSYVSRGGEDEAVSYAAHFLRMWRSSLGAIPWLRKTLTLPLPQPPKPRKPIWSLFRYAFLRLPQVAEEVWQIDACRLPLAQADGKTNRPPWALVLWNRTEDNIMTFEAGDAQPSLSEAWNVLVEALLRPRAGDPHRPMEIQVRRKTFFKAWLEKLRQIGIECQLCESLDGLDRVMEDLLPASGGLRRFLEEPETPAAVNLDDLSALPQSIGESWQADVRRLPGWLEHGGELRRPWASLVTSREAHGADAEPDHGSAAGGLDLEERG